MKFLCDRCKTRYSIGDDRVRGKILKIRCKNCANVITVREGMSADDPASDRNRPTTAAPMSNAAPANNGALASAFASQLSKPPPALEEEWYVSIDGDQSGPFALSDAQQWIASKAFDADVHCWSEGFDDWLPVDKVSHFRGLRKKPAPPPPLPRAAPNRTGPAAALQQTRPEDLSEPKPLFASTMASLEKAAGLPPSPQTPPLGILAKANGTGSAPIPRSADNGRAKSPAIPSTIAVNNNGSGPNHNSVQGLGQSAGAKALAAAFDASDSNSSGDAAFPDKKQPALASIPEPESNGAPEPPPEDDEDDGLDIGEVSRVVKLADLMKTGNAPRKSSRAPVANMRATGSTPKFEAAALGTSLGTADAVPVIASPEVVEPAVAAPVVAQAHRRGLIMLIGVAAVLLAGVIVLLVVMMNKTDDNYGGLGSTHTIDTSRPEDIVLRQLPTEGSAAVQKPLVPIIRHPVTQHPNGSADDPGEAKGDKLKSDEIEDMARKQSAGTQRCYMRAQRGAEGIEIADLKKLSVTLTVDKTGTVTDVALSEHGADMLGQCLSSQIKRWKFRESPGGLFRIILAFAS